MAPTASPEAAEESRLTRFWPNNQILARQTIRHLAKRTVRNLLVSEHHNDSDDAQSKHHEGH